MGMARLLCACKAWLSTLGRWRPTWGRLVSSEVTFPDPVGQNQRGLVLVIHQNPQSEVLRCSVSEGADRCSQRAWGKASKRQAAQSRALGHPSPPSRRWSGHLSASGSADQLRPLLPLPYDALAGGSPGHSGNARPAFHRQEPGSAETPPGKTIVIINKNNDNSCPLWGPFWKLDTTKCFTYICIYIKSHFI